MTTPWRPTSRAATTRKLSRRTDRAMMTLALPTTSSASKASARASRVRRQTSPCSLRPTHRGRRRPSRPRTAASTRRPVAAARRGDEEDLAVLAVTVAPRRDRRVLLERQVHDAPIPRTHRTQANDLARRLHLLGEALRHLLERLAPPIPIALNVDDDPTAAALAVPADEPIHHVLEGVQRLTVPPDHQPASFATHREDRRPRVVSLAYGDSAGDTEVTQDLLEERPRPGCGRRRRRGRRLTRRVGCFPGNIRRGRSHLGPQRRPHARLATAEAEQTAGCVRQNLDLDTIALDLERPQGLRNRLIDALTLAFDRSHATQLPRLPTSGRGTPARWPRRCTARRRSGAGGPSGGNPIAGSPGGGGRAPSSPSGAPSDRP